MRAYFDTSLILAILQNESSYAEALGIWTDCVERFSSLLLRIEATISIRRNFSKSRPSDFSVMEEEESELGKMLSRLNLIPLDNRVSEIVEQEKNLSQCRSLDAVHLATALFLQREAGEPFVICSYDARMREAALGLGFAVLP